MSQLTQDRGSASVFVSNVNNLADVWATSLEFLFLEEDLTFGLRCYPSSSPQSLAPVETSGTSHPATRLFPAIKQWYYLAQLTTYYS
jgi:hypothetical protein